MWCAMTDKIIKVDRVGSAAEAAALESAGADIIGVEIDPSPRFDDDRTVGGEVVTDIRRALRGPHLAVTMNLHAEPADVLHRVRSAGADLVQSTTSALPPAPVRSALRDAGIGVVYAGIEISHDDDPAWVFDAHDDAPDLQAALFQVDVLPEYPGSWAFLRDRSPEFEDEFQVEDLDRLARSRPLIAGFDLTAANYGEIAARLPHVRGFAFTLADQPGPGVRCHSFAAALTVLQAIRR